VARTARAAGTSEARKARGSRNESRLRGGE
jgi:hypothetical protein